MILCRRPFRIFDVDVIGAVVFAVLLAGGWYFVWRPWCQTWAAYRSQVGVHAKATKQLQTEIAELDRFATGLHDLRAKFDLYAATVPTAPALPDLLATLTETAQAAHLELRAVVPRPTQRVGGYLVADIQITAQGASGDFVNFLDRFAQVNPHQALTDCRVQRPLNAPDARCELQWTTRLYLLPVGWDAGVPGGA